MSKELKMEKTKKRKTENTNEVRTKNIEEMEKEVKEDSIVDTAPTGSGAAQPEAEPEIEMLRSAMEKYCFVRDTLFNDLEDKYELDTRSVLTEEANLVLAHPRYSICSARGQPNSAHDVFLNKKMADAVRLVGSMKAPAAHGHVFRPDLVFYH